MSPEWIASVILLSQTFRKYLSTVVLATLWWVSGTVVLLGGPALPLTESRESPEGLFFLTVLAITLLLLLLGLTDNIARPASRRLTWQDGLVLPPILLTAFSVFGTTRDWSGVTGMNISFLCLGGALWYWRRFAGKTKSEKTTETPGTGLPEREGAGEKNIEETEENEWESETDESIVQQWTRSRSATGGERIEALFRVDFSPQHRYRTLHLPFSPPFGEVPEVEVLCLDSSPLKVSLPLVLPQGARVDLKREQPVETPDPENVRIMIIVQEAGACDVSLG